LVWSFGGWAEEAMRRRFGVGRPVWCGNICHRAPGLLSNGILVMALHNQHAVI